MTIYTDASHRSTRLTLGVYNNRTGEAIAQFAEPNPNIGNNTRYAELLAIELGCSLFPNAAVVNDNRGVLHWLQTGVYPSGFDEICRRIRGFDRELRWVPREHNVVADWLASSLTEISIVLPPGLGDITQIPMPEKGFYEDDPGFSLAQRRAMYGGALTGSASDLRRSPDWVLSWLLSDAKQKHQVCRERSAAFKEVKRLEIELTKVKAERSKLARRLDNAS